MARSGVVMTFYGAQALQDALMELAEFASTRTAQAANRRAMVKSLEPVRDAAERMAPKGKTGRYARSIKISSRLTRRQARMAGKRMNRSGWDKHAYTQTVFVGPTIGEGGNLGVLAEFGTQERVHKNGKAVGRMAAHPHMRPAWDQNKDQVLSTYQGLLWREIAKATERARRRQERRMKSDKVVVPRRSR